MQIFRSVKDAIYKALNAANAPTASNPFATIADIAGLLTAKVDEAGGITKGQVVNVNGATGGFPEVSIADNTDFTKSEVVAIATEAAADNQSIQVQMDGLLEGIDTSAFTEGDILYLGAAGAITNVHPVGINAVQRLGTAVKINASTGSMLIHVDELTIISEVNDTLRHQLVNLSTGATASAGYTVVNDDGHRVTMSLTGAGHGTAPERMFVYNEGYGETNYWIDGNVDHVWYSDTTDSHNFSATEKMRLTAAGELITMQQDIVHTALEDDDHALEIDCNADGHDDVKALDIDYITGAIAAGQDEAVILVNIDESAATGGTVAALEVLATEGDATLVGMVAGVGVNPIAQLAGVFEDMDSALVNATDRLTEFTTAGDDIQMFLADNDTITIGNALKFEEIEFLLAIVSPQNVRLEFEFSTGTGTWASFTPVDGTNGMRNTGVIAWVDGDIPTWAVGTGSEYLIRITRTRNNLNTPPTESKIQIAVATEFGWDKDANLVINDLELQGQGWSGTNTLADGATVATDCSDGNVHKVVLDGNRTLGAPTNLKDGATYIWMIYQDDTVGTRTCAFNAVFDFGDVGAPTITTGVDKMTLVTGVSDGTNIFVSPSLGHN